MEGCPDDDANVWYTILTGCLGLVLFVVVELVRQQVARRQTEKKNKLSLETKRTRRASLANVQRQLSGRISLPDGMVAPEEENQSSVSSKVP